MKQVLRWTIARGREPSTYAGLAALLIAFHVPMADSWARDFTAFSIGLFGLIAMVVQETGHLD
jgi:hypothetical protein